jgi:hypothetical protein
MSCPLFAYMVGINGLLSYRIASSLFNTGNYVEEINPYTIFPFHSW